MDGQYFQSPGFGDGSGKGGVCQGALRCGWGVASCNMAQAGNEVVFTAVAYGPLIRPRQDVPAAELTAFLTYLLHVLPEEDGRVCYYTDCSWLRDTFLRGEMAATDGWAVHADLWKKVFHKVNDIGRESVDVKWTKAHRSINAATSRQEAFEILGNNRVDKAAKTGADMHVFDEQAWKRVDNMHKASTKVAKFISRTMVWRATHHGVEAPRLQHTQGRACAALLQDRGGRHEVAVCGNGLRCIRCLATSTSTTFYDRKCEGANETCHKIWRLGPYIFCVNCGAYSAARTHKLGNTCTAPTQRTQERLRTMLRGKDPKNGELIGRPVPMIFDLAAPPDGGSSSSSSNSSSSCSRVA